MLATNWKHQWLPLCFARSVRTIRIVAMVRNPIKSNQNLRVFWKPVNPQDCVWENHYRLKDHIAGKGDNSLQHYNLVHKFIPVPQAMKIPAAKAAVDKEWEKLEKISGVELDESQK